MNLDRRALLELEQSLSSTRRAFPGARIEVRASGSGATSLAFDGYACITDHGYEMYGGPPYGWTEIVARGAFKKTLAERADVQLLINHDGEPLARTKSGTLTLVEDDNGLRCDAPELDPNDPDVKRVAGKMARGDIDEMSFAFRVVRQRWEDEDGNEIDPYVAPVRRILEVSMHKGDVSIVNYGANDATFGAMRGLDQALAELRSGRTLDSTQRDVIRRWVDTSLAEPTATRGEPAEPPAPPAPTGVISLAEARRRSARTAPATRASGTPAA